MTEAPRGDEKKRNIYLLGLVSLLNDASSEIIQPILPLFITSLGAGGLGVSVSSAIADQFGLTATLSVFPVLILLAALLFSAVGYPRRG